MPLAFLRGCCASRPFTGYHALLMRISRRSPPASFLPSDQHICALPTPCSCVLPVPHDTASFSRQLIALSKSLNSMTKHCSGHLSHAVRRRLHRVVRPSQSKQTSNTHDCLPSNRSQKSQVRINWLHWLPAGMEKLPCATLIQAWEA